MAEKIGPYLDELNRQLSRASAAVLAMGFECDAHVDLRGEGARLVFKHADKTSPLQIETWDFNPVFTPLLSAPWRTRVQAAHRLNDLVIALRARASADLLEIQEATHAVAVFAESVNG